MNPDLIHRYLQCCDDIKALTARKKVLSDENKTLKECIIQMMHSENKNKIECGSDELILKKCKRTKNLTVGDVIVLLEDRLKGEAGDQVHLHQKFVEDFMDGFLAEVESSKDVTESYNLQVKRTS